MFDVFSEQINDDDDDDDDEINITKCFALLIETFRMWIDLLHEALVCSSLEYSGTALNLGRRQDPRKIRLRNYNGIFFYKTAYLLYPLVPVGCSE